MRSRACFSKERGWIRIGWSSGKRRLTPIGCVALLALAGAGAEAADAQAYPTRPVRVVIPLSPGGNVTIVTRALAQKMSEALGQQLIVDNRPGGNGVIGAEIVARAAPDGYTVLTAANSLVSLHGLMA